jgi:hypothetical protein
VLLGIFTAEIKYDEYQTGTGTLGTISYRTGATQAICEAASWNTYSEPFSSLGWVQIKLEKT